MQPKKLTKKEIDLIQKVLKAPRNTYSTPLVKIGQRMDPEWNIGLDLYLKGILKHQSAGERDMEGPKKPFEYRKAVLTPYFNNVFKLKQAVKTGVYQ